MKKNILIVIGHSQANSIANKKIGELLKRKYPDAEVDNLRSLYPNYQIDVVREQEKLRWADVIVIQSPLFWYSMSSLVMRWIEEVFVHGWAYGSKGHALDGKKAIIGITAGSNNEDYQNGRAGISIAEITKPIKLIFDYCRMDVAPIVFTGGMFNTGENTTAQVEVIEQAAVKHCQRIEEYIEEETQ